MIILAIIVEMKLHLISIGPLNLNPEQVIGVDKKINYDVYLIFLYI